MFGFARLRKNQPKTKKAVYELTVSNFFGRWMTRNEWGAMTIPLLWFVVIFYWASVATDEPDPLVRVHEFHHVAQDEKNAFFLVTWVKYTIASLRPLPAAIKQALMDSYQKNSFEAEAYEVEAVAEKNGLPEWAQ